jgi:imidazoleglycerol-phosphate dehydratase
MTRQARAERATAETTIRVTLDLDGTGVGRVETGSGFFDHMLAQLSRHSLIDLDVEASGDLGVDEHHTVEDCGILIGRALDQALGDRAGIRRYGDARIPMDEALATCAIDLGGRAYSVITPRPEPLEGVNPWLELLPHFCESVAREGRLTLHLDVTGAESVHHHVEAAMKALARALREAAELDPRLAATEVPSTKGSIG